MAEEKEEELAEYKRQLALVSMDSSRSKDALELQEKITELEKELARDREDELLEQQKEEIQNQEDAYDDMVEAGEDELETFLSDANNFAEELNSIMEMSQNDLLDWLSDNVAQFALSTQAAQEQMLNSWTDTYEQYKHIVEMWNDEIDDILTSKDKFLEYMKQSDEYVYGDEQTQASLLYEWGNQYDDYVNSLKTGAVWSHSDSWTSAGTSSTSSASKVVKAVDNNTKVIEEASAKAKENTEKITKTIDDWTNSVIKGGTFGAFNYTGYADGGIVTSTGAAMLHGSMTNPEYVLNTDEMNALVRNLTSTYYTPPITTYTPETTSNSSVGDIYITINEAAISSDADINELAARVGEAFSNELGSRGFNTRWNV